MRVSLAAIARSALVFLCVLGFGFWVIFMTGHMVRHGVSERTHSIGLFHLFIASFIRKTTAFLN